MLIGGLFVWTEDAAPHKFSSPLFFQFMLPFLIFGIGYNMKRRRFFRNLGPIIMNGVVATTLNFILLSWLAWTFTNTDSIRKNFEKIDAINIKDSMTLGGVLSSTEMVITLSILKESTTPKLQSILFGENIISTAISILLVNAVKLINFTVFNAENFFIFVGYFFYNCLISVVLGMIFGFMSALMTKNFTRIKNSPSKEVALQFYIAWTGYLISEMFLASGVITILICAIISGHYAYYNMTRESRMVVTDTFHLLGDGTRALIFSYLGLTCFSYSAKNISFFFMFLMLISIMVTRLLTIFGLALVLKLFSKKHEFNVKNLAVIWAGGLFRGTIAFALLVSISVKNKEVLQVTVLGLIIFTMTVYGALVPLWIVCIRPSETLMPFQSIMEAVADGDYRNSYFEADRSQLLATSEDIKKKRNWLHRQWRDLDNKYIKPCLINKESLDEQLRLKQRVESMRGSQRGIEIEDALYEAEGNASLNLVEKYD